ncbi:hypothetical protein [Rothia sp. ZJ1223]|uniref:hypothetical protein n=1 Tax=Rothia sp. ZJ1223 TaxID=2811098 RepID=UPI0019592A4C|nr:hypothetical protein [Rothia sp. ZJ1223]MBM7051641.1 hypothetical protein [Rothia sp. ZJ1223]
MPNTFAELDARATRQDKERAGTRKSYTVMAAGVTLCLGLLPLWRYLFPDAIIWFSVGTVVLAIAIAVGAALAFRPSYGPMRAVNGKASALRIGFLLVAFSVLQLFHPDALPLVLLQSAVVVLFFFAASWMLRPPRN